MCLVKSLLTPAFCSRSTGNIYYCRQLLFIWEWFICFEDKLQASVRNEGEVANIIKHLPQTRCFAYTISFNSHSSPVKSVVSSPF